MSEYALKRGFPFRSSGSETELPTRSARKDGREVVTLRSVEHNGAWIVECDVYPLAGFRVDPLRPGPYRFASRQEAAAFMNEAALALTYLGCEISSSQR